VHDVLLNYILLRTTFILNKKFTLLGDNLSKIYHLSFFNLTSLVSRPHVDKWSRAWLRLTCIRRATLIYMFYSKDRSMLSAENLWLI